MAAKKQPESRRRRGGPRNVSEMSPTSTGIPFGPDVDDRVPGEIVVKLRHETQLLVTESIPPASALRAGLELPTELGISALDSALARANIRSIVKVHEPMSPGALGWFGVDVTATMVEEHEEEKPGIVLPRRAARVASLAEEMDATYRVQLEPEANVEEAVATLAGLDEVLAVEPLRYRFTSAVPNDPNYGVQWGLAKIRCPEAWDKTKGSNTVVVAVIDTGADLNHPDLAANLKLPGRDLVHLAGVSAKPGWHWEGDFLNVDDTPQDEVGHGTHVAGTIAAVTNNMAGVAGVTWFCKVLPVKVLARMVRDSDGAVSGSGISTDVAAGIKWAADNGAHIINMSLGSYGSTFVESDAVAYAIGKGCLVIAAMGNDNTSSPSYPAAYPNVFSVGATTSTDTRAVFATWGSNFGPHIDACAPGVGIRSTDWDNIYSNKSGTSMATPHVSGVAALIKSCKSSLTATQIADILRTTAVPLKDNPADPIPNDKYGYGRVDAKAAIDKACPSIKFKFADEPKFKFIDEPKFKFADEPPKNVIDPPKLPGFEGGIPGGPGGPIVQRGAAAPFVLSTPHHSMAWAQSYPGAHQQAVAQIEAKLMEYQQALAQWQRAASAGQLSQEEQQQFENVTQQCEALMAEYRQLSQGR